MKSIGLLLFACITVWAQAPASSASDPPPIPNLPDDTVVAVFDDGTQFTMADFKKYYAVLPPANQQMALRNRQEFIKQWALARRLSQLADKDKLGEQSPYKEALEFARMNVLMQAKINDAINRATVEPAEIVKYYDVNKEKYKQVKIKAIYITFRSASGSEAASSGKKGLTEDEAKAKATKLLAQIRGGADFVKMVAEHSEDETSKAKNGDFATLRPSDNIPDTFRSVVFALKQGEISEPLRQPNGYYLLRAEEITYRPLSQARDEIFDQLKHEHYNQWFEQLNRETTVKITNPAFAAGAASPAK